MKSEQPRRRYVTAKERAALRRGGKVTAQRRRGGCLPFVLMIGALALVVIVLIIFLAGRIAGTLQAIEQDDPRRGAAAGATSIEELPADLSRPFNVLLIGVDRRPDPEEGVRGDTLIVVRVDPHDAWAGMLSIPRDTVVGIRGLGQQKINTAYTHGFNNAAALFADAKDPAAAGGALAAETVEQFLGLKIDYIAQVDFNGFQRIVDTLGGVTVDPPQPLLDAEYPTEDYGVERIYIPAGLQVMDGRTALAYARSRHSGSDFDRAARQQQVLQAILREVRERGLLDQAALLPDLARDLEQTVATTLPISDLQAIRGMAALARSLTPERIVRLSLNPNDVEMVEQGSDLYWNQDDVRRLVQRLMAGPGG